MQITAIKAQLRNPERVSIYLDGEYSFSLTQSQLLEFKLHTGKHVDDTQALTLKRASDYGKIMERVMNYIMIRPRSVREVRDYLWRKKADQPTVDSVVDKLQAKGYLNDTTFAQSWIRSRQLTKPISRRRLVAELQLKGVASEIITQTLASSEHDDSEALRELIVKKRRQSRYQDEQKLIQYLARQGFGYDAIKNALQSLDTTSN